MTTTLFPKVLEHLSLLGLYLESKVEMELFSIPGAYNGREGFFEFIKEPNGNINQTIQKELM